MHKFTIGMTSLLASLFVVFVAGCGQEVVNVPTVISTMPANGAPNVAVNSTVGATFSTAMKSSTVTASSFTVTGPGGTALTGAVSYSGSTATFTPSASLAFNTPYTATITTGVTALGGTPLVANYSWSFTTGEPAPLVISTTPVNGTTGVALGQSLSATFNDVMNCATLSSTTFTLTGPGTAAVAGTVSCAGNVATFTPSDQLAVNTVYAATITTGAQNPAGAGLAGNYGWTFITASASLPPATPPTVISTAPVNGATAVPAGQGLSASFSVAMTPASISAATFTLSGPGGVAIEGAVTYVPAGSIATFIPADSLAPSTLYVAKITTGAMNTSGTPLAGNYSWSFTTAASVIVIAPTVITTAPENTAINVSLNQAVSASFSVAMNPVTITAATFSLSQSDAGPVAGLVTYSGVGNTATFTPAAALTPDTVFTATVTTGAQDLANTGLASNYAWTFTTGAAIVVTPPEIISTIPANATTGVARGQAVSATFSKAMNPLTITTDTFQVVGPDEPLFARVVPEGAEPVGPIAGIVSYDAVNNIATFSPSFQLESNTTYTVTISGATDLAGDALGIMGAPNPWTFTTGTLVELPPVVLGPTIVLFGAFGGGAGITNQGTSTVVTGNIGTTGASTTVTGFYDESAPPIDDVSPEIPAGDDYPCAYTLTPSNQGLVNGAIDTAPPPPTPGCSGEGNATTFAVATQAALEAQTAYNTLQGLPPGTTLPSTELGNLTLPPGTYTSATFYAITAGPLTLDAHGDPDASWVFQVGSYLTVGTPTMAESVILIGGAQAKNVFWAVGGLPGVVINYGGGGTMVGTVISGPGITVSSPGVSAVTTVNGRLLALHASSTMVNTVINVPAP